MKRILSRVLVGVLVAVSVSIVGAAADRAFAADFGQEISAGLTGKSCVNSIDAATGADPPLGDSAWTPSNAVAWTVRMKCFFNNPGDSVITYLFSTLPLSGSFSAADTGLWGRHATSGDVRMNCAATWVVNVRGQGRLAAGTLIGSAHGTVEGSTPPPNYIDATLSCSSLGTFGLSYAGASRSITPWSYYWQATRSDGNANMWVLFGASGTCRSITVARCTNTHSPAAIGSTYPDWFGGNSLPMLRACPTIGISYRVRDVGSTSWQTVTPGGAWPALDFGALIEWSMSLNVNEQVDHLVFSMIGATPLSYTGDPPNWSPGQLQPFALDLLDSDFLANDAWMSGVGIGAQWEIRPGDAMAVQVGPVVHTGTFNWWGYSGTQPAFNIECRANGVVSVFTHRGVAAGGSVLDVEACKSWNVYPWEPAATSVNDWGFILRKPASTTGIVSLEYRIGGLDPPASWTMVYSPPSPVTAEVQYQFAIARSVLPDPALVEWRCTANLAGGGTTTAVKETSVNTSSSSDYGREGQDEGCYARVSSDMSLTSPKSWVTGAGKLGSCVVQWLVVPETGYLNTKYGEFEDELEVQAPFSFLFIADGFLADVDDTVTDMEAGDAPEIPIASFTIGGATVDTSGFAPGAVVGDAADPDDRSLLTLLLLAGVVWAVLRHAAGLLFERSPIPDDDPVPTNFGGSGR